MATIEDIRKLLQDFVAPDLGILKEGQVQLRTELKDGLQQTRTELKDGLQQTRTELKDGLQQTRTEMLAAELRTLKAIEAAKAEILLTVKVNTMSERIAELTRENEKLKAERSQ